MPKNDYVRKEYTVAQIAYLAGLIDGEGSIYIGNPVVNDEGTRYFRTNVEITNGSKPMIDWLANTFGGKVCAYGPSQTPKNSRQPHWRWIITGERVTHLCELILPYLTAKVRQCEIMLKMRATFNREGKGTSVKGKQGVQRNSEELLNYREKLMKEMMSLHCRNYKKSS